MDVNVVSGACTVIVQVNYEFNRPSFLVLVFEERFEILFGVLIENLEFRVIASHFLGWPRDFYLATFAQQFLQLPKSSDLFRRSL